MEGKLCDFGDSVIEWGFDGKGADVAAGRDKWLALQSQHGDPVTGSADPEQYSSSGQDIVEQMLIGAGFRIVGSHDGAATRSLVLSSRDPKGVQFVVTAHEKLKLNEVADAESLEKEDSLKHFDASNLARFSKHHKRQGIASLAFFVSKGDIDTIQARYAELHPKLLVPGMPQQYGSTKVLEVYAYYKGEKGSSEADTGTVLRFSEVEDSNDVWLLPGVEKVDAKFCSTGVPTYFDHWVSNVSSRTGFLDTLNDTLGFTPKVDFNAGVVAAGEAQIESTVTGNSPTFRTTETKEALQYQGQIYLPINNALSEVGHVNLFLKQLGQGVQHVASRVADLPTFIQRANDFRKMTGAGFSFLGIPPSYYGYINTKRLVRDSGIDEDSADRCVTALREAGIVNDKDIVDIEVTREKVAAALPAGVTDVVVDCIMRGRYNNLYDLLRDKVSEDMYMRIVRNKILVDIQGEDVLMQIFTSQILQRAAGEEAPFCEFIQRVCSECLDENGQQVPIRPGCGGFGIRNFLTLFLSIEVSASSEARAVAEAAGDAAGVEFHSRMVDIFIQQLSDSNPILTAISDAMTAEGLALERGDVQEAQRWADEKDKGQADLMVTSTKYKNLVRRLREERKA